MSFSKKGSRGPEKVRSEEFGVRNERADFMDQGNGSTKLAEVRIPVHYVDTVDSVQKVGLLQEVFAPWCLRGREFVLRTSCSNRNFLN
jgi:hypothetical protein